MSQPVTAVKRRLRQQAAADRALSKRMDAWQGVGTVRRRAKLCEAALKRLYQLEQLLLDNGIEIPEELKR